MTANPRPSAGGVIVNQDGEILLVHQHGNSWSFPKGGIELGESELDAAKREIFEETGLRDITFVQKLGSYKRYSLDKSGTGEVLEWGERERTLFLFTTNTDASELTPQDSEVTDAKYFTYTDALKTLTHPKDKAFLESVHVHLAHLIR